MKPLIIILCVLFSYQTLQAQKSYAADVESLDAVIHALYEVISGDKGEKRDWDRFYFLFSEDARLMPSSKNKEGKVNYRVMSPQEYREGSGNWLEENGFFEKEINRVVEQYGSLTHVWSTYESYRTSKDTEPFSRGINSIQCMHDGARWWILQIYWLGETPENPLPEKYLPKM